MVLATRFIEGVGYIIAVVSAPSIIAEASSPADRRLAVGMWGSFMPTGMAAMLLASPFLQEWAGWRGSWLVMSGVTAVWALLMAAAFCGGTRAEAAPSAPEHPWRNLVITLSARGPWLLSICFGFYTLAWLALMVWLPTFMMEERALSVRFAALITLVVVTINLPGNLLGGWLMHKGVSRGAVIAVAAAVIGVSGPLVFLDVLPDGARFVACLVYSFIVGVVPATILGTAPYFAPGPGQIGSTYGLIVQGSHLGQFAGPPLIALAVTLTGGWQAGAWVFLACGVGVLLFAGLIAREDGRLGQGSSDSNTP
jgi:MFS family permease